MKAVICSKYGGPEVLQLSETEKPVPKENEILVRVFATSVNTADWRLRKPDPWAVRLFFGLTKPKRKILGVAFSGQVESTGKKVTYFKPGDEVFGSTGLKMGAYAEYICLPENGVIALKPKNISHVEAATIPFGATTALYFLRKSKLSDGQKILIYGASGSVGTAAVQLAKYFGAEVTGVCSTANVELVKSIGADQVIDYTRENIAKHTETYDVVFETVDKLSYSNCMKILDKKGTLILGAAGPGDMLKGTWASITGKRKVLSGMISEKADDMKFISKLIESGKYKPVVDRIYPMEQIAEAHRYAEDGHKKGNLGIAIVDI
jgi:NADPH:quinone reductase-like Zn-dependent oxidoreductase